MAAAQRIRPPLIVWRSACARATMVRTVAHRWLLLAAPMLLVAAVSPRKQPPKVIVRAGRNPFVVAARSVSQRRLSGQQRVCGCAGQALFPVPGVRQK